MSTNRFDMAESKYKYTSDARLLYISSAKYEGDWHCALHSHQCTELFYVVGGLGGFNIENQLYQVKMHDLVLVNPNVQHTEVSWNSTPLEYIVLGVEGLELTADEGKNDRFFILNFKSLGDTVLNCMRMMLSEIELKETGFDSVCQNLLHVVIMQLMRHTSCSSPEKTVLAASHECAAAKWYIDAHFKEHVSLDMLAKAAGLNKFYLGHSFTEEYGISTIKYLNQKRIEESRHLLRSTDLPLGRIAQMLGFSSPSHFAQMFKKLEGCTPSDYRQFASDN